MTVSFWMCCECVGVTLVGLPHAGRIAIVPGFLLLWKNTITVVYWSHSLRNGFLIPFIVNSAATLEENLSGMFPAPC